MNALCVRDLNESILWNFVGFAEFYRVLPGFTEFYRVLAGFVGFCRVLPGFVCFHPVLPSLPGFARSLVSSFIAKKTTISKQRC